jgi:pimeloyl-ACP methyl ester carboxylesterase
MDHRETPPETLIVPVAGVGNIELGPVSTAQPLFLPLRLMLQHDLRTTGTSPVVLSGMGIFRCKTSVCHEAEDKINSLAEQHPGSRIILLGHSMGGLICRDFLNRNHRPDGPFAGTVTVNAPHLGANPDRWPREAAETVRSMNEFALNLPIPTPPSEGGPQWSFIGSLRDNTVAAECALPDFPEVSRLLLVGNGQKVPGMLADIETASVGRWREGHNNMLLVRPAAQAITRTVGRMMLDTTYSPAPDTHGHHRTLADIA